MADNTARGLAKKAIKQAEQFADQLEKKTADKAKQTEVTASLSLKAEKKYVDDKLAAVNEKVAGIDKGYGATFATLTLLKSAYPTGDAKRYVVAENGHWYFWNGTAWVSGGVFQSLGISEKSVKPSQTTFIEVPKFKVNYFDKNAVTPNGYFDGTGIWRENTGVLQSDFIPVIQGDIIRFKTTQAGSYITSFFDNTKTYMSGTTIVAVKDQIVSITIPIGCFFVRCAEYTPGKDTFMITKNMEIPSRYYSFSEMMEGDSGLKLSPTIDVSDNIKPRSLSSEQIKLSAIKPEHTDFLEYSPEVTINLFDKSKVTLGFFTSAGVWTEYTTVSESALIPVTSGDTIRFKATQLGTYQWIFLDKDKQYKSGGVKGAAAEEIVSFTVPVDVSFLRCACYNAGLDSFMVVKNMEMPDRYYAYSENLPEQLQFKGKLKQSIQTEISNVIPTGNYKGKKLSILADSISTFTGHVPQGNAVWYTGSNDVNVVEKIWWKRLLDQTGMELCVNNAWSGSHASGTGASAGNVRATLLHKETSEPDVIIVFIGINDFNNNVAIGTYNGEGAFPTTTTTFREAYAIMLDRIMTRYPRAEIYCSTLPYDERTGVTTFPESNGNGVLLATWNKAIRELADLFGANIMEFSKAGLTHQNRANFTLDNLHPNSAGHRLLANKAIKTIEPVAKFSTL